MPRNMPYQSMTASQALEIEPRSPSNMRQQKLSKSPNQQDSPNVNQLSYNGESIEYLNKSTSVQPEKSLSLKREELSLKWHDTSKQRIIRQSWSEKSSEFLE